MSFVANFGDPMIPNGGASTGGGGGGMSIGGAVTGGSDKAVLFIHPAAILDQDVSNFSFDDAKFVLNIGNSSATTSSYNLNTVRAIFTIPNASGNNWFEGNSGNTTLTGSGNFGTGDNALSALTSGADNVAVGSNALEFTQSDVNNIAIGSNSLQILGVGGAGSGANIGNIALGNGSLNSIEIGGGNVAIGTNSLANINTSSSQNTAIGQSAGGAIGFSSVGSNNVMIGANCGANLRGGCQANTWFGGYKAPANTTVTGSILFSDGFSNTAEVMDYGYTFGVFGTSPYSAWTMSYNQGALQGAALHIYNIQDVIGPTQTNWERVMLDWNITSNVFRIASQKGGTGTIRIIAIDGFQKAGAPAAGDIPSGTWGLINDTSGGNTWLCYNNSGTIRKVQLV